MERGGIILLLEELVDLRAKEIAELLLHGFAGGAACSSSENRPVQGGIVAGLEVTALGVGGVCFYEKRLCWIGLLHDGSWRRRGRRVGNACDFCRRSGYGFGAGVNNVHHSDVAGLGLPSHVEDGAFADINITAAGSFAGMAAGARN